MIDSRAYKIEKTQFFTNTPSFFQKVAIFFEFSVWEQDEVIQEQDKPADHFYWIIQGSCMVSKRIPFVTQSLLGHTTLRAFDPATENFTPLKTSDREEKIDYITLKTHENLEIGDHFPYIPLDAVAASQFNIKKEDVYINRLKSGCEYSVVANSAKVITASVNFADFMDIASASVIKAMIDTCKITRFPLKILQEQYLNQRAWDIHKKNTINAIVKDNGAKKDSRTIATLKRIN
jgi:hypothetical protein